MTHKNYNKLVFAKLVRTVNCKTDPLLFDMGLLIGKSLFVHSDSFYILELVLYTTTAQMVFPKF
jgi:hypothetical protein